MEPSLLIEVLVERSRLDSRKPRMPSWHDHHGVSEALYLRDPDENGVEFYWDRSPEQWPRGANGELRMFTRPLDLQNLLAETKR